MALTPMDWIKTINCEAELAFKEKRSRYDVRWGIWSAAMNRSIKARIESGDPDSTKLKFVFLYWVLMSQAVEFVHKRSKGRKINETRFCEVVGILEYMKKSIDQNIWPEFNPVDLEAIVVGRQ
jgi:hypothetical protein